MIPDRLALRLRVCAPLEAADLGVRLCQVSWRPVYVCYLCVLLPVALLSLATAEISVWLPSIVLWWAKPWLDRSILFVLARAAFGQSTTLSELWRSRREVWWRVWWKSCTLWRLSMSRSAKMPVHQLEQLRGKALRLRVRQLMRGRTAVARTLTGTFSLVEQLLAVTVLVLIYMVVPSADFDDSLFAWLESLWKWSVAVSPFVVALISFVPYLLAVAFLEPFYVAAGFAIYLNRRVELEAWDIEQDLRHAFAS